MPRPVRPPRRALAASASVLVAGLVGAGCGQPAVLAGDRTEQRIGASLAETFDVEVTAVQCPEEVRVQAGSTFSCAAELGGATLDVDVRQIDDDGALRVEPTEAVLVTARVETDIAEVLADRFDRSDLAVSCPGGPQRLEPPDATFTCTATDGDERKGVEVRVRDVRGALTYTVE